MRSTREGRPTTDPKAALAGGVVLPIGEHKGSGISMFMDIFGGVISGANFGGDVGDQYKAFDRPQDVGHFFLAMKPNLFVSEDDYRARIDTLIDRMKSAPLAEGFAEVLVPGEPEDRIRGGAAPGRHPLRRERGRGPAGRSQARRHPAAGGGGPPDRGLMDSLRAVAAIWTLKRGRRSCTSRAARRGIPVTTIGREQCPNCVPLLLAAAGLLVALTTMAAAQADYPNRPVRLIIPFPPGGSNDVVGRMIGTQLSEQLGKQVIVDNRAGAGGVIGTELASQATPDGYTILVISLAHAVNPWLYKLPYDPIKAFAPIGVMGSGPNVRGGPSRACRSIRSRNWWRSPSRSPATCNTPRPASAPSSISAPSCSSSKPASTSCTCRSRAAARR